MLTSVDDPKAIVRRGYDLLSRAYRADDAEDGAYGEWLDLLERRLEPGAAVLDLGCGNGIPVARRLAPHYAFTGVDFSPVQVERARALVPMATFLCADMTRVQFPDASFDAVACLYALIHLPLEEQPMLLRRIHGWVRPGGLFVATVGHGAWTGTAKNWLGVEGGDMWWSHADTTTYRTWLTEAGLTIERETFVPEGTGGHIFLVTTR
jgi:SAM-dependent methyltransferase